MNALVTIALLFALTPPPPPRMVAIADDLVVIVWANAGADSAVVFNTSNADCPYPTVQDGLFLGTVLTQVPGGPPYEARCALRPGDALYLQSYRDRQFVDSFGPFVVPYRIHLPLVHA